VFLRGKSGCPAAEGKQRVDVNEVELPNMSIKPAAKRERNFVGLKIATETKTLDIFVSIGVVIAGGNDRGFDTGRLGALSKSKNRIARSSFRP
jgi:hypothetical protein